jgi:phosphatidylserine decarboxylase
VPSRILIIDMFFAAMLVGSIGWSAKEGDKLKKGDELGWFQYGGSTCIVVLPSPQTTGLKFDQDLSEHSGQSLETVVSMGMQVATVQS